MSKDTPNFKELLDLSYDWPSKYTFKFIVPMEKVNMLTMLLADSEISTRPSKKGKYISITAVKTVASADEVIEIYERVSVIEGIVSL